MAALTVKITATMEKVSLKTVFRIVAKRICPATNILLKDRKNIFDNVDNLCLRCFMHSYLSVWIKFLHNKFSGHL